MSATDDSDEPLFRDCWVMSLADGFRAYELSKDRSQDWRFASFRDVLRDQFRMSGVHLVTALNVLSYLRFRMRDRTNLLDVMRRRFVYELGVGMIEAIGYLLPRVEGDKPVLIPQNVWMSGELDWDRCQVNGAGFTFTDIRILMPRSSVLLEGDQFDLEPLPELRPFGPSEERRLYLGLIAGAIAMAKRRTGRPSHKDAIQRAYEHLKPHDGLPDKELFHRIREHVRSEERLTNAKGLGDSAIQKHVIRLRDQERTQKN